MADWNTNLNTFNFTDLDTRELGSKNYKTILSNIDMFRRENGRTASKQNWTTPVSYYFKPFFYFDSAAGNANGARLLGLDWDMVTWRDKTLGMNANPNNSTQLEPGFGQKQLHAGASPIMTGGNMISNSAVNFLLQNREWERAEKLLQFIDLLSDISTNEPWQFQQLSGINEALTRKIFSAEQPDEQRKSITFKCLPSGYNDRIGTLMDLYRDVCFSYKLKKEIVPANLRKFDMGIYIFSTPVRRFSVEGNAKDKTVAANIRNNAAVSTVYNKYRKFEVPTKKFETTDVDDGRYYVSVKYIEFLNCEFDYNSNVGAYTDLNNAEGKQLENEIKIFYDDCYELRYNEFLMRVIGDAVFQDDDFECLDGYYQVDRNYTNSNPSLLGGVAKETIAAPTNNGWSTNNLVGDSPTAAPSSFSNRIVGNVLNEVNQGISNLIDRTKSALSDNKTQPQSPGALSSLGQAAIILEGNVSGVPIGSLNQSVEEPVGVEADTTTRVVKRGFVKKL